MAGVVQSIATTKKTTNYSRLCRLLVDICSQALRDTFDGIHAPANLHTVLASQSVHSTLQALFKGKKRILNPAQWCKLYPAIASSVSSATFDITLLMILLRNICDLRPPVTGWGNLPSEEDKSLEADIVRIKHFRNTVYALAAQASVNDATFNTHWQKIRAVLVRLGGAKYEDAIDKLKTECMDPDMEEHYKELLQQWKKDEYVIKEQLHEMGEDIKYIKEALRVALNSTGRIDNFNNVHSDSIPCDTEASADQTIGRKPKRSMLSKGRDDVAKDTYSSAGSTVSERNSSGGTPAENQVFTDHDSYGLSPEGSQTNGATQDNVDARYRTFPRAGSSYTSKHFNCQTGHSTVSGDSKAYSSQESANINEACGDGDTDWSCSRCTLLNPSNHRVCVVCGATRGIGAGKAAKHGSKVCWNCTLHNEERATVCKACHEPLSKSETVV